MTAQIIYTHRFNESRDKRETNKALAEYARYVAAREKQGDAA